MYILCRGGKIKKWVKYIECQCVADRKMRVANYWFDNQKFVMIRKKNNIWEKVLWDGKDKKLY